MSKPANIFLPQSPFKILQKANHYNKTLKKVLEIPVSPSKANTIFLTAQQLTNQIDFAISESTYQQQLFRKKEREDLLLREKYEKKLKESIDKNSANCGNLLKKKAKVAENYERHLKEVHQRHEQQEKQKILKNRKITNESNKEIIEFYEQITKKKERNATPTTNRINHRHDKNIQSSIKTEESLEEAFQRNGKYSQILEQKRRSLSLTNRKKELTYRKSQEIFNNKEQLFIQKYGKNEESSIRAFHKIQQECNKTRKRISESSKFRSQRSIDGRKRWSQDRARLSQRCATLLQKTRVASFIKTSSSFKTKDQWNEIVKRNKTQIKDKDEAEKDKIMQIHLDLTIKNHSIAKISEKLQSMKMKAKKLTTDFL